MAKKKTEEPKKPVGRPTDYSLEIATRICEEFALTLDSYEKIKERNPDFPERATMRRWRYKHEEFRSMYDQARRDQADLIIEEIREIARCRDLDLIDAGEKHGLRGNTASVARDRLIIDTEKWIACKVLPKIYGTNPSIDEDKPFTDEERMQLHQLIARLVAKHEREY